MGEAPKNPTPFPEWGNLAFPFELLPQKRILLHMDTAALLLSFLFGTFGLGYFVYGKKQANWIAMVCGAGLIGFPYFVSNVWIMVAIGLILMALPIVFRDYA